MTTSIQRALLTGLPLRLQQRQWTLVTSARAQQRKLFLIVNRHHRRSEGAGKEGRVTPVESSRDRICNAVYRSLILRDAPRMPIDIEGSIMMALR